MKRPANKGMFIAGLILFLAVMSYAGKEDRESAQAVLEEQVNIRDAVKERYEREWSEDRARFELLGKGGNK